MKCQIDSTELLAFSARKLAAPEAAKLEQHTESCAACREFVEDQRAVWQALDAWEVPPVTADFDRRLRQRIEQGESWWDRWAGPLRVFLVRQGIPIAATACLIVVAGLIARRPAEVRMPAQTQAAVENLQADQVDHVLDDLQMLGEFTSATRSDAGEL